MLSTAALLLAGSAGVAAAPSGGCPFGHGTAQGILHTVGADRLIKTGRDFLGPKVKDFNYTDVKQDLKKLMTDSQDFWPADYGPSGPDFEQIDDKGHYGGLFIRLAWHCNGSFRQSDGRGGCDGGRIRHVPEFAWPDNANIDKALRLLKPIKEKYGDSLSWGDLISLSGNVAIEDMGGPTMGFCGGRQDDDDGTASLTLGPTRAQKLVAPCEQNGKCVGPLGPSVVGLIYVNPGGTLGNPDPKVAVDEIRSSFSRMGMNDRETVALIGGGHTFGKAHGACGDGPGIGPSEDFGKQPYDQVYSSTCGEGKLQGKGKNTVTAGYEGRWTPEPTTWDNKYFKFLFEYDFELQASPAGGKIWVPQSKSKADGTPAPKTMMFTTDLAMREDPSYREISLEFAKNITALEVEFAAAWYKLLHNDMGPATRCGGPDGAPPQPFQDPLPPPTTDQMNMDYAPVIEEVKKALTTPVKGVEHDVVDGKPSYAALFTTLAYNCAGTFRATDYRGGCNGGRIRFSPQAEWKHNKGLVDMMKVLEPIKAKFPAVSNSDLIVLAGTVAAGKELGIDLPFCPGRTDALDGNTEVDLSRRVYYTDPATAVTDQMNIMGLTPQDVVALAGRPYSTLHTKRTGWTPSSYEENLYKTLDKYKFSWINTDGDSDEAKDILETEWKAELGTKEWAYVTAWHYALTQSPQFLPYVSRFAADEAAFKSAFAEAWTKLMNADRFDGPHSSPCDSGAIWTSDTAELSVTKMEAAHIPSAYPGAAELSQTCF